MPDWASFASELETAAVTAVTADPIVGVGGTLGVLEVVRLQAVSGELLHNPVDLPSVGIAAVSAVPEDLGPLDEIRVRLIAVCTAGPTELITHEAARVLAVDMGSRVVKVLKNWQGTTPGASGHHVLIRGTGSDEVTVDDDDLTESIVVEVTVAPLHKD